MHFCFAVITKEFPTDEVIREKIDPYYEDRYYDVDEDEERPKRPIFLWDWFQVGGRYGGKIKLRMNDNDETYKWKYYAKEPRAGRLFRSMLLEEAGRSVRFFTEEYYHPYLGSRDGYIRVDGCKVSDVIDFEETAIDSFGFIGKNGEVYCRRSFDGDEWVDDLKYDDEVRAAIEDVQDCYLTFVDIHD